MIVLLDKLFCNIRTIAAFLAVLFCLSSCVDQVQDYSDEQILFAPSISQNVKAIMDGDVYSEYGSGFVVSAYRKESPGAEGSPYISEVPVIWTGDRWESEVACYWPISGSLDFVALSPASLSGWEVTDGRVRSYSYEITPQNFYTDVCYAMTADQTSADNPVDIAFHHALSRVIFDWQGTNTSILSIRLNNIYTVGSFDSSASEHWSNPFVGGLEFTGLQNSTRLEFLIIPQVLGSNVSMEVTYLDKGAQKTSTIRFEPDNWGENMKLLYRLSFGSAEDPTPEGSVWIYLGDSSNSGGDQWYFQTSDATHGARNGGLEDGTKGVTYVWYVYNDPSGNQGSGNFSTTININGRQVTLQKNAATQTTINGYNYYRFEYVDNNTTWTPGETDILFTASNGKVQTSQIRALKVNGSNGGDPGGFFPSDWNAGQENMGNGVYHHAPTQFYFDLDTRALEGRNYDVVMYFDGGRMSSFKWKMDLDNGLSRYYFDVGYWNTGYHTITAKVLVTHNEQLDGCSWNDAQNIFTFVDGQILYLSATKVIDVKDSAAHIYVNDAKSKAEGKLYFDLYIDGFLNADEYSDRTVRVIINGNELGQATPTGVRTEHDTFPYNEFSMNVAVRSGDIVRLIGYVPKSGKEYIYEYRIQ